MVTVIVNLDFRTIFHWNKEGQWKLGLIYNSSKIGKKGMKSLYALFFL